MKIIINDPTFNKEIQPGDSNNVPIPRIGEQVYMGYAPAPHVRKIVYIYDQNIVYVEVS